MKRLTPYLILAAASFHAAPEQASAVDLAKGEAIYQSICFSCHGKNLEGATGPKLTDGTWVHGSSDQDILKGILSGFPEKGMPGFKGVYSDEDLKSVVAFVKSRRQGFANLRYEVYQGLGDDEATDFDAIKNRQPIKTGTLPDGILDVSFVEIENPVIYFEGDLLAPNKETRELTIDLGWKNLGVVTIDGELVGKKTALKKASQPFRMLWKKVHHRLEPNILLFGANERDGLSLRAAQYLKNTVFVIQAQDEPYIVRKSIDQLPSRSIAVGFPSSMSYAYHAPTGAIVGSWQGDSINVGPNIIGRGKDGSRPVKRWLFSDQTGLALTVDGQKRSFKLLEYTRGDTPTFLSQSGPYSLQFTARPISATSLEFNYVISGQTPSSVSLNIPEGARVSSPDGQLTGNTLRIDTSKTASFSLTLSE